MTGRAPSAVALVVVAAVVAAFSSGHPLVLAAIAAGAVAIAWTAPNRPGRWIFTAALVSGAGVLVLTPLVAAQGDLILLQGPSIPLLDTEITAEELIAGGISALRLVAVTLLISGALGHMDTDRLQAAVARIAPRSALTVALSVRLLPALERDARAMSETARLRGVGVGSGSWMERTRAGAQLVTPLVGSSLERGMDVAEAMAARGYGGGTPTRPRRIALSPSERALVAIGTAAAALTLVMVVTGSPAYEVYPVAGSPLTAGTALVTGAWAALMATATAALKWRR
ncbi:MAG: energy-coupling factor transporter transmembrane protein EcfT [Actinobacteria bacterium]|nr:energy-coupling factor transporter transmembrane protein EcfT [Thermoleophilia bacterium]MCB9011037.1 energy-coupling factor transporter transmembrane protein EcfT [Actinomycetota bacterium]